MRRLSGSSSKAETSLRPKATDSTRPNPLEAHGRRSGARAPCRREPIPGHVGPVAPDACINRAIAEALILSERTVENHAAAVFNKLNVRSRVELAAVMLRDRVP